MLRGDIPMLVQAGLLLDGGLRRGLRSGLGGGLGGSHANGGHAITEAASSPSPSSSVRRPVQPNIFLVPPPLLLPGSKRKRAGASSSLSSSPSAILLFRSRLPRPHP